MPILEPAIRPPAEAESFLLQITTGCSANTCTFCGAYKGKAYGMKDNQEIMADIAIGAKWEPETRRVFLMDGDALALKNEELVPILKKLNQNFPKLSRISSYANGYNITNRSNGELLELYEHKLKLVYIGLESGSQEILNHCHKRSTVEEMIEAVRQSENAGIKSSVMVLLGLGGKRNSQKHVRDTIAALNQMQPRYLSFLSVMLIPGTKLFDDSKRGLFEELQPIELLRETRDIIEGLKLKKTIFRSDHASNYLSLEGRLPADKNRLLDLLGMAIAGEIKLKPELMRGL